MVLGEVGVWLGSFRFGLLLLLVPVSDNSRVEDKLRSKAPTFSARSYGQNYKTDCVGDVLCLPNVRRSACHSGRRFHFSLVRLDLLLTSAISGNWYGSVSRAGRLL